MGQEPTLRVEIRIEPGSKLLSKAKTVADIKHMFSGLNFEIVKYIYQDPKTGEIKGVNPPDDVPIVEKAYITVVGNIKDIVKFTELATKK